MYANKKERASKSRDDNWDVWCDPCAMPSDTVKTSKSWTAFLEERQAPGRAAWMYASDHPRLRAGLYDTHLGGPDPFSWMRAHMAAPARQGLEIGGGEDPAFGLIEAGTCERIDAGHLAADLVLIEPWMAERTVAAAVFNPQTLGVMEGLCRHFAANPRIVLAPFAWASNKPFLCHWQTHATLLAHVHGLLDDPAAPAYIAKSRAARARNQGLGFAPALFGYEIFAFEWT